VVKEPLDSKYLSATYPQVGMPFYLYGSTQDSEYHIDHTLVAAPNAQFTAGEVIVDTGEAVLPPLPYIEINVDFPERAMQPFPSNKDIANDPNFFFRPNKVLPFTVTIGFFEVKGSLTLTKNVFVDTDMLNEDPVPAGECYACEYSLRAHAYMVVLLGAHADIIRPHIGEPYTGVPDIEAPEDTEGDTEGPVTEAPLTGAPSARAPGREWQDIIVCTWSLTWA
jgi:hypothetical protein